MSDAETPSPPPPSDPPQDEAPAAPPTPPPAAEESGSGGSENRTVMIVLSYLWILALIPLLIEKEDAEVQWHAKHGLVLTAAEFILWIVLGVASTISVIGCILAPVYFVAWIGTLVLHIVCMVKGVKGERFMVPGISQYADRF